MRKNLLTLFAFVFGVPCSFAGVPAGFEKLSLKAIKDAPAPAEAPAAPSPETPVREWTLMFFINGKSNVEQFALADMNKLEAAGSSDKVNVVVELGRMKGQSNDTDADGDWTGSRRYYVVRDTDTEHITSPVLLETPKADMGDYRRAADFVRWSKKNFPAKRYMLLVWDHGWGWLDPKAAVFAKPQARSVSHDFENKSYIRTTQLGPMLKEAGGVDVYASMACFMQMAEVAWELKNHAKVIVGSEEVIQLASFDFADILRRLEAAPEAGPEELGGMMVESFKSLYCAPEMLDQLAQTKYGVQLSAIRAGKLDGLRAKLDRWAELAMSVNDAAALKAAKTGVVRMEIGDETSDPKKLISFYADLGNFMEIFASGMTSVSPLAAELKQLSLDISGYLGSELSIAQTGFSRDRAGKDYSACRGLSINIPGEPGKLIEIDNKYSDLSFAKESRWDEFTDWFARQK